MTSRPLAIQHLLLKTFNPEAAQGLLVSVRFVWGRSIQERCQISIAQGAVELSSDGKSDLTIFFSSQEHLRELVLAKSDPFELFLRGDFRSDGGLPYVFPIFNAFIRA